MKTVIIIAFVLIAFLSEAQVERKFIQPLPNGYSQAVLISGGKTLFISGQIAKDAGGAARGDLRMQTMQVYESLKHLLSEAGATFDDVVKLTTYIVNLKTDDLTVIREVRSGYHNSKNPPTSTLIGVQSLADPDGLIEIEAIAVLR